MSTSTSMKKSQQPPQKKFRTGSKKQAQLTSFFSKPQSQSKKPTAATATSTSTSTEGETSKSQQDVKAKEVKRTVTIKTIEKNWKTKQLARYDAVCGFLMMSTENMHAIFASLNETAQNDLICKFEVTYFVIKEELHVRKYEKILALEEMHGVQHDKAYKHDRAYVASLSTISATNYAKT